MKKSILFLFLMMTALISKAQDVEMADQLRGEGKIYVVIGVILIILTGVICYLIRLDSKLRKLEKNDH
jgi:uncharacterized membrane protein